MSCTVNENPPFDENLFHSNVEKLRSQISEYSQIKEPLFETRTAKQLEVMGSVIQIATLLTRVSSVGQCEFAADNFHSFAIYPGSPLLFLFSGLERQFTHIINKINPELLESWQRPSSNSDPSSEIQSSLIDKSLLSAHSSHFRKIFQHDIVDPDLHFIKIPWCSDECAILIDKYLRTSQSDEALRYEMIADKKLPLSVIFELLQFFIVFDFGDILIKNLIPSLNVFFERDFVFSDKNLSVAISSLTDIQSEGAKLPAEFSFHKCSESILVWMITFYRRVLISKNIPFLEENERTTLIVPCNALKLLTEEMQGVMKPEKLPLVFEVKNSEDLDHILRAFVLFLQRNNGKVRLLCHDMLREDIDKIIPASKWISQLDLRYSHEPSEQPPSTVQWLALGILRKTNRLKHLSISIVAKEGESRLVTKVRKALESGNENLLDLVELNVSEKR